MRWCAAVLLLVLGGCGAAHEVGVDVAFDVDPQGRTTSAKCIASTSGACHIEFRGAQSLRAMLQPGEMRRFAGIGPGVQVCIDAEAAGLAACQPVTLGARYARVRKGRLNRVAQVGHAG